MNALPRRRIASVFAEEPREISVYERREIARQAPVSALAVGVFAAVAIWAAIVALTARRGYQDSWILEGLAVPFALLIGSYLVATVWQRNVAAVAALASVLAVLMYALPALKYAHIYSSTIDASVHLSMVRTLAESGVPEPNYYQYTPGLHLLAASLAQLSGLPPGVWLRLFPPLVGGLIPLGTYVLYHRAQVPQGLTRAAVILSPLSLPVLYSPNGTTYAALIAIPLLLAIAVGQMAPQWATRTAAFALTCLLFTALTTWHSITSLYLPLILVITGLGVAALRALGSRMGYRYLGLSRLGTAAALWGLAGASLTLLYWGTLAEPLWTHLGNNVGDLYTALFGLPADSPSALIPERTATLDAAYLGILLLIYHGRDASLIILSALSAIFLVARRPFRRILRGGESVTIYFTIVLGAMMLSLLFVFASGYSTFGYARILRYASAIAYLPAAYAVWITSRHVLRRYGQAMAKAAVMLVYASTFAMAAMQLYPYQPAIPSVEGTGAESGAPLHWVHRVNTEYQYRAIVFAYDQLPPTASLYTDYTGHQQAALFLQPEAKQRFRSGAWQNPRTSYVLLHVPGRAGAYGEQAEYRSQEAIEALRQAPLVHTVYDNGGSFILLVPAEQMSGYSLRSER